LGQVIVRAPPRARWLRKPRDAATVNVDDEDVPWALVATGEGQLSAIQRPREGGVVFDAAHDSLAPGSIGIHDVDRVRADVRHARGRSGRAAPAHCKSKSQHGDEGPE